MNCGYEIPTLSQKNTIKGDETTRDELMQRDTTSNTISSQYEYTVMKCLPPLQLSQNHFPTVMISYHLSVIFRTVNSVWLMSGCSITLVCYQLILDFLPQDGFKVFPPTCCLSKLRTHISCKASAY